MPCARVCGVANMGNMGGRAEMDGAVPSPPFLPCRPVPGQNLTRSLGRQASPEPFLLLSGAGTPACQRGSDPGGREAEFVGSPRLRGWSQGTLTGSSTPCLTGPTCHAGDSPQLSQSGQEPLPSWPRREKVAGVQPTLCQGLMGHQLRATSPLSSGRGQGNGGKSQRWP